MQRQDATMNRTRSRVLNVAEFVAQIQSTLNRINQTYQQVSEDGRRRFITELNTAIANLDRIRNIVDDQTSLDEYRQRLQTIVQCLQDTVVEPPQKYSAPTQATGAVGRPRFLIPKEQLEYLMEMNFSVPTIAKMLGVHKDTTRSRMREYDLSVTATYTDISDAALDSKVQKIIQFNKNIGFRMLRARLLAIDIKVTYQRVRESMMRVDAPHIPLRLGNTVTRRKYNVAGPNALWHIDGNHKLIRWGFVIHGCVDGYSRLITFMKVSTNNRSATVLKYFKEAREKYGLPSRLRCDKGVENTGVVTYMTQQRGQGRGSAIIGPSVHNQRIERTWVDLFQCVLCVFHDLFSSLVQSYSLDTGDPIQMYSLQYAFTPIIQRSLDRFVHAFNVHPVSTERSRTPEQLFVSGLLADVSQTSTSRGAANFLDCAIGNIEDYGIDYGGPVPAEVDRLTSEVQLEDARCPVPELIEELKDTINPLELCEHDIALVVYQAVLTFFNNRGY